MWQEILSTLFPMRCIGCEIIISSTQSYLCENCKANLPFTHIPFIRDNSIYDKISESVKIEFASSLLFFSKKNIWYMQNQDNPYLKEVNTIIPVPIHYKRFKQRNYNQIILCCKRLASLMNCNFDEHLLERVIHMESQIESNKDERMNRMKKAFIRTNQSSSHYLLVDDVLTTGATLISCAHELLKIQNSQVSIFTLAIAS